MRVFSTTVTTATQDSQPNQEIQRGAALRRVAARSVQTASPLRAEPRSAPCRLLGFLCVLRLCIFGVEIIMDEAGFCRPYNCTQRIEVGLTNPTNRFKAI